MFKSKRLLVNIGIFGAFLFAPIVPWYVLFIAGVWAGWYFVYYELLLIGLLLDIQYQSVSFFTFLGKPYPVPCMTAALVILIILHLVKKRVRF